jgi:hypothetical protein
LEKIVFVGWAQTTVLECQQMIREVLAKHPEQKRHD